MTKKTTKKALPVKQDVNENMEKRQQELLALPKDEFKEESMMR